MAILADQHRTAPTIFPPACDLVTDAQELRAKATEKRILATRLQKEARELELAADAVEKRTHRRF